MGGQAGHGRAVRPLLVLSLLGACIAFLAMAGPVHAEVAWSVQKLGPAVLARDVDIDGSRVVWVARATGADWPAVYLYDDSTGQTTMVGGGTAFRWCAYTQIEGDWVVWQDDDVLTTDAEIYAYRISTHQTPRRITNNGYPDLAPYLNGGRVVWVQEEPTDSELYAHHLDGNVTNRITNNVDSYHVPRMDGDWIVSQGVWGGGWDAEIKLNSTTTGFAGLITNNYLQDTNAEVSGDWVTWEQSGAQSTEIMLYNIATHQTRQLTSKTPGATGTRASMGAASCGSADRHSSPRGSARRSTCTT